MQRQNSRRNQWHSCVLKMLAFSLLSTSASRLPSVWGYPCGGSNLYGRIHHPVGRGDLPVPAGLFRFWAGADRSVHDALWGRERHPDGPAFFRDKPWRKSSAPFAYRGSGICSGGLPVPSGRGGSACQRPHPGILFPDSASRCGTPGRGSVIPPVPADARSLFALVWGGSRSGLPGKQAVLNKTQLLFLQEEPQCATIMKNIM